MKNLLPNLLFVLSHVREASPAKEPVSLNCTCVLEPPGDVEPPPPPESLSVPTIQLVPLCLRILPFAAPVVSTSPRSPRFSTIFGLLSISDNPVVEFQSDLICAAGIDGGVYSNSPVVSSKLLDFLVSNSSCTVL